MDDKLSMLIADDTSINRTVLRDIFSAEYDIYEAENGIEAMEIIRNCEIDIILLDICMPVMDGMEVLRQLNKDCRFSKIPVIVNSVLSDSNNEIEALDLGADEFIANPYNPEVLKRRVRNIASKYLLKRKQLAKDLESKSEQLSMLVDTVPGGIGELKGGSKIHCTFFNDGLCDLLGYDRDTFLEQVAGNMESVVVEEDRGKFRKFMDDNPNGFKSIRCTIRFIKSDKSVIWLGLSARKDRENCETSSYYTVFTDMTEEKTIMQELRAQVEKDPLTSVYNRGAFYERTKDILEDNPGERYVVVQWNIDRFKVINALYGSQCGDRVLIKCADILCNYIDNHGICGRLEADHFVGMLTMDYVSKNMHAMEKMLSEGIKMDQIDYPIMMHAGFYEITDVSESIDIMCDCANLALQEVKKNYLRRWEFFNEEMRENLLNEQTLINEMEQALNSRQFVIRLQPIYDTLTREIASAEALVRWQHPQKGLISPGVFIPLFEKNGFIAKLDLYVWEEVCRMIAFNEKTGRENIPVSVNVSRVNFYNPDLLSEIEHIVEKYGIDHSLLKFEITESAYMENPLQLVNEMEKIKEKGYCILMDDFGSGYSSLNTLKDVPVDILKIDMKFLDHLENSPKATSILYSVIKMAQALEISVIVEGVETKNQFEMLKSMGCEYIQGYYFSRPLSVPEFQKHLELGRIKGKRRKFEAKKTILVVDDLELNRATITSVIKDEYQIVEAEDGKEAYKILSANPLGINLVITDILMPVMDGFELLKKIQRHHLLSRIPVLVLTAFDDVKNESTALSLGALDVIMRPFDQQLLVQRIHNLLKVSENDSAQAEIHSLREGFAIKRHMENIIHSGKVGFCDIRYDENGGDYRILSVEYANSAYYTIHSLEKKNGAHIEVEKGIFSNMVKSEREEVMGNLYDAFRKRKEFVQDVYDIVKEERLLTIVFSGLIRYEENGMISLALFEMPIWSEDILMQKHLLGGMIQEMFKETRIEAWCYDIEKSRFIYSPKKFDHRSQIKYVEGSTEETLLNQGFLKEDMERVHSMFRRIEMGETTVKEIFKMQTNNNTREGGAQYRWLRMVYKSFLNAEKRPVFAIGMAEDVTDEIASQQVREKSLEVLEESGVLKK